VYRVVSNWLQTSESRLVGVAGASIGAINAAIIGRNWKSGDRGRGALDAFWQRLVTPALQFFPIPNSYWQRWNGFLTGLTAGNAGLNVPNYPAWNPLAAVLRFRMPFHHTGPMESILAQYVGNYPVAQADLPWLLVRAMNVQTGAAVIFNSTREVITPRHLRASAAIPLLFDPIELQSQWYWDGDICSRTVLEDALPIMQDQALLESGRPLLIIVVNTYPRAGRLPRTSMETSFRLEGLVFGGRSDNDEALIATAESNRSFMEQLHAHARLLPQDSPLKTAIDQAWARTGKRRLSLLRIDRVELEHDHVSRAFDYSAERVAQLIAQGEHAAAATLASVTTTR
jgi:predicted acylesterase/phospholipase RssA